MAEAVQYSMEAMVPELETLQKWNIFTSEEIKDIIRHRTNFEYRLKRRITEKEDYLRYIAYELNLILKHKQRTRQMFRNRTVRHFPHHYSGIRHVHRLFQRALRKFKGDISLWLTYIDFCQRYESFKLLSKVFAKTVTLHPLQASFWCMAAAFEYNHNQNILSARSLMQRALRMLPESQHVWLEYFRLELNYSEYIRRKSIEHATSVTGTDCEESFSLSKVASGTLPLIVFKNASKNLKELSFYQQFIDIYNQSERVYPDTLDFIYAKIIEEFPMLVEARLYYAKRHVFGLDPVDDLYLIQLKYSLADLSNSIHELPTPEMMKAMIHFIDDIMNMLPALLINDDETEPLLEDEETQCMSSKEMLHEHIRQLYEFAKENNLMDDSIYISWINYSLQSGDPVSKELLNEALHLYPKSSDLIALQLKYLFSQVSQQSTNKNQFKVIFNTIQKVLKNAMATSNPTHHILYTYLTWLILVSKQSLLTRDEICQEFIRLWHVPGNPGSNSLFDLFMDWMYSQPNPLSYVRQSIPLLTRSSLVSATLLHQLACRHRTFLSKASLNEPDQEIEVQFIRSLFNDAVLSDPLCDDIWMDYIQFENDSKKYLEASRVYSKALLSVRNKETFMIRYDKLCSS